jgi:D-alanyl-D-alanine carboxypeptidase
MRRKLRVATTLALLCCLAACAGHYGPVAHRHGSVYAGPSRYYPPPGTPDDPWGPYIGEASARYGVPEQWIRAVMRQESGGHEQAVSSAGAMGLMQIMPDTYDYLRQRHALGGDPFEPHDNIMAGAAYIREMYDRYGTPGFLAAYNAGPARLDDYLGGGGPLPDETVNYVASIAPRLGGDARMTGPLAVYAQGGNVAQAYTPVVQPAAPVAVVSRTVGPCDPDAAYDPDRPCPRTIEPAPQPPPTAVASRSLLYHPVASMVPSGVPAASAQVTSATESSGAWAIQVGAFSSPMLARAAATEAHDALPDLLSTAQIELSPTTPFGGKALFRARLGNLSANVASAACGRLTAEQQPCMVVPPGQSS